MTRDEALQLALRYIKEKGLVVGELRFENYVSAEEMKIFLGPRLFALGGPIHSEWIFDFTDPIYPEPCNMGYMIAVDDETGEAYQPVQL